MTRVNLHTPMRQEDEDEDFTEERSDGESDPPYIDPDDVDDEDNANADHDAAETLSTTDVDELPMDPHRVDDTDTPRRARREKYNAIRATAIVVDTASAALESIPNKRKAGDDGLDRKKKRTCAASEAELRDRPDMIQAEATVGGVVVGDFVSADRQPRQRRSKSWKTRIEMVKEARPIANMLPAFPIREADDWDTINKAVKQYASEHHLQYRKRTTRLTATHNKTLKPAERVPTKFKWVYRVFRCTHGCYQDSRSTGERARESRFIGCPARFTAEVKRVGNHWKIFIRNETRTHNHQTTKVIAESYVGSNSIDNDPQLKEKVADMVELRAEPRLITAYLAKHLNRNVTPQQARNMICRIQGGGTAQARLKEMLHKLVQAEGNDVLLIQDDNAVTIGIVIQTSAQKKCFEEWGECLVMDWTHATNNIGYHLGSLLVTSPTGRGIPVVDFVAVDEKAVTMRAILEFFKKKNKSWTSVQTFVIDKDFVEWSVLNECFPNSKVLLCQYHAITYWRKLLGRRVYDLNLAQKETFEAMFARMLKSSTASSFLEYYEQFSDFCQEQAPEILDYFDRNWKTCIDMWANFARSAFFTAGNTTTNRIEANWNQLKRVIGGRPGMDRTIAGVLRHQVAVIRDFSSAVVRQTTTARGGDIVPPFLRRVSALLSDAAYKRLKKEWDILCADMKDVQFLQKANGSEWEIFTNYHSYICHDINWKCSCQFSTTNLLPCRHLMLIARDAHKFIELPEISIPRRWSVRTASDTLDDLNCSLNSLLEVLDGPRRSVLADAESFDSAPLTNTAPSSETRSKPKCVSYVELRRQEQANMVVMSDTEKYQYAKAVVDPMLDRLASLSTAKFYKALAVWSELLASHLDAADILTIESVGDQPRGEPRRESEINDASEDSDVVDAASGGGDHNSVSNDDCDIGSERTCFEFSEKYDTEYVSDVLGDMEAMAAIEDDNSSRYLSYVGSASQVYFSPIEISKRSQDVLLGTSFDCDSTKRVTATDEAPLEAPLEALEAPLEALEAPQRRLVFDGHEPALTVRGSPSIVNGGDFGGHVTAESTFHIELNEASTQSSGKTNAASERNVDLMSLASPKPRNNARKKAKQGHLHTSFTRIAVITWPTTPISLGDVIRWANNISNVKLVYEVFEVYPVVMTDRFLEGRQPLARHAWVNASDYDYNFVVPKHLVRSMESVIANESAVEDKAERLRRRNQLAGRDPEQDERVEAIQNGRQRRELILSYGKRLKEFTSGAVHRLTNFYALKTKAKAWHDDLRWLKRSWDLPPENFDSYLELYREGGVLGETRCDRDKECVESVLNRYETSSFMDTFRLLSGNAFITFSEAVGCVARDCQLCDSVINIALQAICDLRRGCKLFDSTVCLIGWPSTPRTPSGEVIDLMKMRYLILPVNVTNLHWTLIIVKIKHGSITAFFYDSLNSYKTDVEGEWDTGMLPFMKKWYKDYAHEHPDIPQSLPNVRIEWLKGPKQRDQTSCGVLIIAQVYAMMSESSRFPASLIMTPEHVRRLRLRILWILLCQTNKESPPPERWYACKDTHDQIEAHFGHGKSKKSSLSSR